MVHLLINVHKENAVMNRWISAALTGFVATALNGCAHPSEASTEEATPVTLATAAVPPERSVFTGPGSVTAAHVYHVGFEIAGRIVNVRHDVGDRVAPGEILASIDAADYGAQYRVARARETAALAAAAKAAGGARTQERTAAFDAAGAAQAQLDRSVTAARLARANRARYDQLFADGDVSAQQHDATVAADSDARAQVAAARAQLAQALAERSLVDSGTRHEDIAAANADAAAAMASADLAAVTLRKTTIASPADAYVLSRAIEPGSEAQPGGVAFTLVDARDPDAVVAVPERKLGAIAPGMAAVVMVDGVAHRGSVTRVEPAADTVTRTANVRVRIAGLRVRPGSVVEVALGAVQTPGDAAVPLAAVTTAADGSQSVAVYDAAHATTARRTVRVIDSDGDRALVTGVSPGTRIVSAGAHLVRPGEAVRVVSGS
jgi:HlyD family secretion protein